MKLNPKQEKFCQLYATTGHATQSYLGAGYAANQKPRVAEANASRLLSKASIQKRLAELRNEVAKESLLTRSDIIKYLCEVITTPINAVDGDSRLTQELQHGMEGMKLKMVGKMDAIKELNRMMGNYEPEKVELNVEGELLSMLRRVTGNKS